MNTIAKLCMAAALFASVSAAGGCAEATSTLPSVAAAAEAGGGDATAGPTGEWTLTGGASLALADRALRLRGPAGEIALAAGVVGVPSVSEGGARFVFARELPNDLATEVVAVEFLGGGWTAPRVLAREGTPDLPAISPDGGRVAFVASAAGIASVWTVAFDGGAPVQLTNVGLRADGKGRPAGFVPIPLRDPPRFAGDRLVWTARDGAHEVTLP